MAALWPGSAAAGPCTGLGAMGPCRGKSRPRGRAETRRQPWETPGSREHHPCESGGGPGAWVPTRHLKPRPDVWEQPFLGGKKNKMSLFGVCLPRVSGRGAAPPSTPRRQRVRLHLRAVTRRKKLRVPVGKSL